MILATPEELETWLGASWSQGAAAPLPGEQLVIVDQPATQIKFPAAPAQGALL